MQAKVMLHINTQIIQNKYKKVIHNNLKINTKKLQNKYPLQVNTKQQNINRAGAWTPDPIQTTFHETTHEYLFAKLEIYS